MASPAYGVNPNAWARQTVAGLQAGGQDPRQVGFDAQPKPQGSPGGPFGQLPTGLAYTGNNRGGRHQQTFTNQQTGQTVTYNNTGFVRPSQGSSWTQGAMEQPVPQAPAQQQTRRQAPYGRWARGTSQAQMAARPDALVGYRPGAARPIQPQSQGTQYGSDWNQVTDQWESPSFTQGGGAGNMAYAPPGRRPPPFQQSASMFGQAMDPSQAMAQRDAFAQNIINSRAPHAANWGMGNYAPPPTNFRDMWGQAGDMVQQGWQNPLQGLAGQGRMMSADAWGEMYPGQPMPGRPQSNGRIM